MKSLGAWAVASVVVGFLACTQSYDDFDFSGTSPTGGTGGSSTTTTGMGGSSAGTTTGGGTGTPTGTGGTGGSGAQGGSGGGTGGGPLRCTDQYSHGNIYELCVESATECEFRVRTNNGEQCDDICEDGGGECLAFYNDFPNGTCNRGSQATCTSTYQSGICVCSRGCGSGPPCVVPQVCSGGNCS